MAKYNNKKTVVDGHKFDSRKEAIRYQFLKKMEDIKHISNLQLQVSYELAPSVILDGRKKPALKYKADFVYEHNGKTVVEDVKGFVTAVYRIKKHLMKAIHNIDIVEV